MMSTLSACSAPRLDARIRILLEHHIQAQCQLPLSALQDAYAVEPCLAQNYPHCALWMQGLLTREQLLKIDTWLMQVLTLKSLSFC